MELLAHELKEGDLCELVDYSPAFNGLVEIFRVYEHSISFQCLNGRSYHGQVCSMFGGFQRFKLLTC